MLKFVVRGTGMVRSQELRGVANRILLSLPPATLNRVRPALDLVDTTRGCVIARVDRPIKYVYFVNRGLVSLVKTMQDGRTVEIGVIGIEGVTNSDALFGVDEAILDTVVQIPGTAFRIRRDALEKMLSEDAMLREMLQRYTRFTVSRLAQTAGCNRLHSLEQRCCRWLLMAHDSALSDTFPLTHELLARMLGVQRAGVSIAAYPYRKLG